MGLIPNDGGVYEVDQDTSREVDSIVPPNELAIETIQDSRNRFRNNDQ